MAFLQWHNSQWLLVIARDRMLGYIHAPISISTPKIIKESIAKYTRKTPKLKREIMNIIGL